MSEKKLNRRIEICLSYWVEESDDNDKSADSLFNDFQKIFKAHFPYNQVAQTYISKSLKKPPEGK